MERFCQIKETKYAQSCDVLSAQYDAADGAGLLFGLSQKMLGRIVAGAMLPLEATTRLGTCFAVLLYDDDKQPNNIETSIELERRFVASLNISFETRKKLYDGNIVPYLTQTPVKVSSDSVVEIFEFAIYLIEANESLTRSIENGDVLSMGIRRTEADGASARY